jgi:chemotaxis regulatin CheY-phosphate phosphatase CheZ
MTAEAATRSLIEAESAKAIVGRLTESLSRDWSRKDIETSLKDLGGHLTNIIVAQEFQDLAGQSIRHALKALVGAIIVTEGGGPTEDSRLSQNEVDSLLKDLMP